MKKIFFAIGFILVSVIGNAQVYSGGIPLTTGMKVQDPQPVDDRTVNIDSATLNAIHNIYKGLPVYSEIDSTLYIYNGTTWDAQARKKDLIKFSKGNKITVDGVEYDWFKSATNNTDNIQIGEYIGNGYKSSTELIAYARYEGGGSSDIANYSIQMNIGNTSAGIYSDLKAVDFDGAIIFDSLADAETFASNNTISNGLLFQVSSLDSANAGYYSFQTSEASGVRFERQFASGNGVDSADELKWNTTTTKVDSVISLSKNLLNKTDIIAGSYYRNSDGVVVSSASYKRLPIIRLEPNTQYTVSGINTNLPGGLYNDINGTTRDSQIAAYNVSNYSSVTFTTGAEGVANYLGLNVSSVEATLPNSVDDTAMLALGTNTVYEEYGITIVEGAKVKGNLADYPSISELEASISAQSLNTDNLKQLLENYTDFDGTSYYSLPTSTNLSVEGDYVEILARCKDATSNKGLGLTGTAKASNVFTHIVGFYANDQFAIRTTAGYLIWDLPADKDIVSFRTYKIQVVDVSSTLYWRLSVDGEVVGDIVKGTDLTINSIGNTYFVQSFIGGIKSFKVHTSSYDYETTSFSGTNTIATTRQVSSQTLTSAALHDVYVTFSSDTITTTVPTEQLQGNFYVYVKYKGQTNLYARYQVAHVWDDTKRADNWRIYRADLYKYIDGVMVDQSVLLLTTGDSEAVFQESGKSDATGGFHGDETLSSVNFFIDGVRITDLTSSFSLVGCNNFRYEQKSTIIETDNETETPRCTHLKTTTFADASYHTRNRLTWLSTPSTISIWYSGISCVALAQTAEYNSELLNYYTYTGANTVTLDEVGAKEIRYRGTTLANGYTIAALAYSNVIYATENGVDVTYDYNKSAEMIVYEDTSTRAKFYREITNINPIATDVSESEFRLTHYTY